MRANLKTRRSQKQSLTRAEKTEVTQRALLDAAVAAIGKSGYADASIAKITQYADVAQGTFYNYFSSQQELFDQLLPLIGQRLIDRIRESRANEITPLERERVGFETFFEFLVDVPEFYRLLTEAETFAPDAHRAHTENMVAGYVRALRRLQAEGGLKDFREQEFEAIGYMLIGMRHYLAMRYTYRPDSVSRLPRWISDTYTKILSGGLFAEGSRKNGTRKERPVKLVAGGMGADTTPRILHVANGHATAEISADDETSAAMQGALSHLAVAVAQAAAGNGKTRKVMSLSIAMIDMPRAGQLAASAQVDGQGADLVVRVAITQGDAQRPIASAQLSMRG